MIEQVSGTLIEVTPSHVVIDVGGMGYGVDVSAQTAAQLPAAGTAGVTMLTRLVVREEALDLYGFCDRRERALFDRLIAISGVGPKLALSVLSTYTPAALATIVGEQDLRRMSQVSGVGKRKAQRLLVELEGVFAKDADLQGLAGVTTPADDVGATGQGAGGDVASQVADALLSMGFTSREAEVALEGHDEAGAMTVESALTYALKRLGTGA